MLGIIRQVLGEPAGQILGIGFLVAMTAGIVRLVSYLALQSLKDYTRILVDDNTKLRSEKADLETRLQVRRDEVHRLNNQIMGLNDDLQICRLQLDAERTARHARDGFPPEREA